MLIVHPPDTEADKLREHIERIGCQVEVTWPYPSQISPKIDVAFLMIDCDTSDNLKQIVKLRQDDLPTIIGIVDYEDPATLQLVLDSQALTVIEKPIRFFGLLTHMILARNIWIKKRETNAMLQNAEKKLSGLQSLAKAKAILMEMQGMSEEEAFKSIRHQAMTKRVAKESIAESIINASELLRK